MSSAVSDADGDIVRCRWSNISQGECNGVCQGFPATLDEVGYVISQSAVVTLPLTMLRPFLDGFEMHSFKVNVLAPLSHQC